MPLLYCLIPFMLQVALGVWKCYNFRFPETITILFHSILTTMDFILIILDFLVCTTICQYRYPRYWNTFRGVSPHISNSLLQRFWIAPLVASFLVFRVAFKSTRTFIRDRVDTILAHLLLPIMYVLFRTTGRPGL